MSYSKRTMQYQDSNALRSKLKNLLQKKNPGIALFEEKIARMGISVNVDTSDVRLLNNWIQLIETYLLQYNVMQELNQLIKKEPEKEYFQQWKKVCGEAFSLEQVVKYHLLLGRKISLQSIQALLTEIRRNVQAIITPQKNHLEILLEKVRTINEQEKLDLSSQKSLAHFEIQSAIHSLHYEELCILLQGITTPDPLFAFLHKKSGIHESETYSSIVALIKMQMGKIRLEQLPLPEGHVFVIKLPNKATEQIPSCLASYSMETISLLLLGETQKNTLSTYQCITTSPQNCINNTLSFTELDAQGYLSFRLEKIVLCPNKQQREQEAETLLKSFLKNFSSKATVQEEIKGRIKQNLKNSVYYEKIKEINSIRQTIGLDEGPKATTNKSMKLFSSPYNNATRLLSDLQKLQQGQLSNQEIIQFNTKLDTLSGWKKEELSYLQNQLERPLWQGKQFVDLVLQRIPKDAEEPLIDEFYFLPSQTG